MVRQNKARSPTTLVWADLSIPENTSGKDRVAVLGHGSDGVASSVLDLYVKALNQAGTQTTGFVV